MANETLGDTIQTQIENSIQTIPHPMKCTITKVYDDNKHVDIKSDLGEIAYVECIATTPTVNNIGLLVFLNGNPDEMIVITK